jgi:zinc protease
VVGQSVADVDSWPDDINKVTAEQVKEAAAKQLDLRQSVTGYLIPQALPSAANRTDGATSPSKG